MTVYKKWPIRTYLDETAFVPPWGMCDKTGLMYLRSELVRQMIQTGDSVSWNGTWVATENIDPLDEQRKIPPIKGDPTPIEYPRPNPYFTAPS